MPALMLLALVGVLFGLGRVLLFRYQCQQRIERQCELEKQFAVRSAIQWIETRTAADLVTRHDPVSFSLLSPSNREIDLEVRPVKPIYPSKAGHFNITKADTYAYALLTGDSDAIRPVPIPDGGSVACQIGPGSNTSNQTGQILVDMRGTGSWLDDTYGRRYMVGVGNINSPATAGEQKGDTIRLFISPAPENPAETITSQVAGAKIGMTVVPDTAESATVYLWYSRPGSSDEVLLSSGPVAYSGGAQPQNGHGFQISDNSISAYYIDWPMLGADDDMPICGEIQFSTDNYAIPEDVLTEFRSSGPDAPNGRELIMVLQLKRTGPEYDPSSGTLNTFKRLQVLPAYEFEVLENWQDSGREDEIATVVHVKPRGREKKGKAYIYDTLRVSSRGYGRKVQGD